MNSNRDIEVAERISILETKEEDLREQVNGVKSDITTLVSEVKQIRNALYFMGAMMAFNIPALQGFGKILIGFLGF